MSGARRYVRRLLLVELAGIAVLLAAWTDAIALRVVLVCIAAGCVVIAYGRWRHRRLAASAAVSARWLVRRRTPTRSTAAAGDVVFDADGLVGVFCLGDPEMLVSSAETPLPRLDRWTSPIRGIGPEIRFQLVVRATRGSTNAYLAVRARRHVNGVSFTDPALLAALDTGLRRASQRLTRSGIGHTRMVGPALDAATGAGEAIREAWDHLSVGPMRQITVRTSHRVAPMNQDQLVRLLAAPTAETVIAWSGAGSDVVIRLGATSEHLLTEAVAHIASIVPVRRLDGEHTAGRRMTLPLAIGPYDASIAPGASLSLASGGVVIGDDRSGRSLRIHVRDGLRISVVVVGGAAVAEALAHQAAEVPVDVETWMHPPDADTLRSADVVVCAPMTPADAQAVAAALDLSATTTAWLSRIEPDMVAVIADRMVRWARRPEVVPDIEGLVAFA